MKNTRDGSRKSANGLERSQAPMMEGRMARWYARQRASASQMEATRASAARLTDGLPAGAAVLEVAPGPGYHAIEMARPGRVRVTGLDISRTFVELASENARQAGVEVSFTLGEAAHLPFESGSFDLVVCQAAFKNFGRPREALNEMHRVLRDGGTAVIDDMSGEASDAAIDREVRGMGLSRLNSVMTKLPLIWLRRRAFTPAQFELLVAGTAFGTCEITTDGIGLEARMTKRPS
ncbi:class I SAM-dependent methyltransferase [Sphaerisporangium corydalis]|uniref:Class I SAM-dependent methyltransferase n=1 Tax=Sphaerisporangium corydalis TaxID=1441875 RepID=A0ABV9E9A3_9ACTN|nr:class I SAM-dependent methyltransferase [Sphaerisporangium corydalis]